MKNRTTLETFNLVGQPTILKALGVPYPSLKIARQIRLAYLPKVGFVYSDLISNDFFFSFFRFLLASTYQFSSDCLHPWDLDLPALYTSEWGYRFAGHPDPNRVFRTIQTTHSARNRTISETVRAQCNSTGLDYQSTRGMSGQVFAPSGDGRPN